MKQPPNQEPESTFTNIDLAMQQGALPGAVSFEGESFGRFIQFLKKRGWLVLVALVLGLAAAMITNVMLHKEYTALAQIEIVPDMSGEFRLEQIQDMGGWR